MSNDNGNAIPQIFVSYSHENLEHMSWVKVLAGELRENGVDALLDEWRVELGGEFTIFMDMIRKCDRVLLICTPAYKRKADEGTGGVGYERSIMTAELAKKIGDPKFICVLRKGEAEEAIPTFAEGRRYVDFRLDSEYDIRFDELLRDLHQAPKEPEPPLGKNPYSSIETKPKVTKSEKHRILIQNAERVLTKRDIYGWRRLVRNIRQAYHADICDWRKEIEGNVDWDAWPDELEILIRIGEPLMILAMMAVESGIGELENQTSLLDDFLNPDPWNRNGTVAIIEAPRVLAFLYHHFLGAFTVSLGHPRRALRLLSSPITDSRSSIVQPLWGTHDIMAWVTSIGERAGESWKYILSQYNKREWLQDFFHHEKSYHDSLRAYVLLGSMLELGTDLAREGALSQQKKPIYFDVPPLFLSEAGTKGSPFSAVVDLAIPDAQTLESIAAATDCTITELEEAWPVRVRHLINSFNKDFHQNYVRTSLHAFLDSPPRLPKS